MKSNAFNDRVAVVIPARLGSTRLPGKALLDLGGKPMIQWVWEAAKKARGVSTVLVATDAAEIADVVRGFGGQAVMTSATHESGTDRVAEAARTLDAGIIVNLQGDEPFLPPAILETLVRGFTASSCQMGTLITPITDPADITNPARAKVVCRKDGRILYFSRLPIPCVREAGDSYPYYKHVGIYIFRREFLFQFAALPPSPLEKAERLEQLRALENGHDIIGVPVNYQGFGVDTPEDARVARAELAESCAAQQG
jgi:3-deoxy-manno-octulosonate cytidylyltransferase (CMP-KDO synthetase)